MISSGACNWKMNLDTFNVAAQSTFLIVTANNPLEMEQVIPRNVGFECCFLSPLSPFKNTVTGEEKRIRSLKQRCPHYTGWCRTRWMTSPACIRQQSISSRGLLMILLAKVSRYSLDYLLFSVCTKRRKIVSTTSMVRFVLSLQKRKLLQRTKPVLPLCSVTEPPRAVPYIQYFVKVGFLKAFVPPLEGSFW